MNSAKLEKRRKELIERSESLRFTMATHGRALAQTTALIDRGVALLRRVGKHPVWIAGLAAGVVAISPNRLSRVLRGGVVALRTWRMIQPIVIGLRSRYR